MALTKRVQQGFLRLPFARKAILISSAALMISPLLPWYDNRNAVGIGETFLGIQGPLFLIGSLVFAFGAVSFFNLFLPLLGRNFFQLRKRSGITSILLGFQSLFLILIAKSIYFHPSFGGELAKATRFGMMMAIGSVAIMLIAGFVTHRKEKKGESDAFEEFFENADEVMAEIAAKEKAERDAIEAVHANPGYSNSGYSSPSYSSPSVSAPSSAPAGTAGSSMRTLYSPEDTSQQNTPQSSGMSYSSRHGYQNTRPAGAYSGGMTQSQTSTPTSNAAGGASAEENFNGDPLTLDAKTRYKMMRSQARRSQASQSNLWGSPQQAADPIRPRIEHDA